MGRLENGLARASGFWNSAQTLFARLPAGEGDQERAAGHVRQPRLLYPGHRHWQGKLLGLSRHQGLFKEEA